MRTLFARRVGELGQKMVPAVLLPLAAVASAEGDLASQARDPTASITAFQIRYDWTANFHNATDQQMGTLVLQPVIPFKLGEQRHIARITLPYVTSAPDFSGRDIDQNPIPPNYLPTQPKEGLGGGWSVGLSELNYTYNFEQSRWADLPIGGRLEKLVQIGELPVRMYVDLEYNLRNNDIAPNGLSASPSSRCSAPSSGAR